MVLGVIPDYEMEDMLVNIFGRKGHPVRKFWRMMYWMPKFKNLSPWLLPNPVPNDTLELAKLAVNQMCTVDLLSEVKVYETNTLENAIDDTWIVSGISKDQRALLEKHDTTQPLHIEGPFLIWLRNKSVNYFTLRGDPPTSAGTHIDDDYDPDGMYTCFNSLFSKNLIKYCFQMLVIFNLIHLDSLNRWQIKLQSRKLCTNKLMVRYLLFVQQEHHQKIRYYHGFVF